MVGLEFAKLAGQVVLGFEFRHWSLMTSKGNLSSSRSAMPNNTGHAFGQRLAMYRLLFSMACIAADGLAHVNFNTVHAVVEITGQHRSKQLNRMGIWVMRAVTSPVAQLARMQVIDLF